MRPLPRRGPRGERWEGRAAGLHSGKEARRSRRSRGAAAPCQPGLHRHLVPAALPARAGPSPPASARCVCRRPPPGRARAGPPSPAAVGAPRSPGLRGSGPGPPWALKGTAAARPGFDVAARGRRTGLAQGKGWGGWRGRPGCPASPRAWGRGRHLPLPCPGPAGRLCGLRPVHPRLCSAPSVPPAPSGGQVLSSRVLPLGPRSRDKLRTGGRGPALARWAGGQQKAAGCVQGGPPSAAAAERLFRS